MEGGREEGLAVQRGTEPRKFVDWLCVWQQCGGEIKITGSRRRRQRFASEREDQAAGLVCLVWAGLGGRRKKERKKVRGGARQDRPYSQDEETGLAPLGLGFIYRQIRPRDINPVWSTTTTTTTSSGGVRWKGCDGWEIADTFGNSRFVETIIRLKKCPAEDRPGTNRNDTNGPAVCILLLLRIYGREQYLQLADSPPDGPVSVDPPPPDDPSTAFPLFPARTRPIRSPILAVPLHHQLHPSGNMQLQLQQIVWSRRPEREQVRVSEPGSAIALTSPTE
jgi:hypothetical protein